MNIGGVDFGVDANTAGLQKAITQLQAFRRVVDQTAQAQTQGAQQAAAALGRQESAIKRAFQQTLNLRRSLLSAGASGEELARVSNAFRILTKEMTSSQLSSVNFARAVDGFNARLNRSSRALKDLQAEQASKKVSKLSEVMRDLESSTILAVGPLSGLGARIRSLGAIANRSTVELAVMVGAIAAVGIALYKLSAGAVRADATFEKINARFLATSDNADDAQKQMAFVIKVSQQLGLKIEDTADSFSRLTAAAAGTALEGKGTRDIFVAIAEAAATLRLSGEDVNGIFLAIQQIMSKGTVAAEELRGQIGERLPGAFNRAAAAMGVTTQQLGKMLKDGDLAATQFLPKLAAELDKVYGKNARDNATSWGGTWNRLSNAVLIFSKQFDNVFGISEKVKGAINALSSTIEFLSRNLRTMGEVAGAVAGAMLGLAAPALLQGLFQLATFIAGLTKALWEFDAAALIASGGVAGIAKAIAAVVGAVAGFEIMRKSLGNVDQALQDMNDTLNKTGQNHAGLNLTKDFDKALKKITDLQDESSILYSLLTDNSLTKSDVFQAEGLVEARKIIRTLNKDELAELEVHLRKTTVGWIGLEDALARVFGTNKYLNQDLDETVQKIKVTPERLREAADIFTELEHKITAMSKGPRAVELYDREAARVKAIEAMRDKLEQTTLTQAEQNQKIAEYTALLKKAEAAEDSFTTIASDWGKTIVDALDEAIFKTKSWTDTLRDLAKQLLEIAIRDLVLNPFEKQLSGWFGNLFQPRAAGGPTLAGETYIVGEKGPELLSMGSSSGHITPNSALGRSVYVEQHIHYDVALESIDARVASSAVQIKEATRRAVYADLFTPAHA